MILSKYWFLELPLYIHLWIDFFNTFHQSIYWFHEPYAAIDSPLVIIALPQSHYWSPSLLQSLSVSIFNISEPNWIFLTISQIDIYIRMIVHAAPPRNPNSTEKRTGLQLFPHEVSKLYTRPYVRFGSWWQYIYKTSGILILYTILLLIPTRCTGKLYIADGEYSVQKVWIEICPTIWILTARRIPICIYMVIFDLVYYTVQVISCSKFVNAALYKWLHSKTSFISGLNIKLWFWKVISTCIQICLTTMFAYAEIFINLKYSILHHVVYTLYESRYDIWWLRVMVGS